MLADVTHKLCYQANCCMFRNVQRGRSMLMGAIWADRWPCCGCITCILSCLRYLQNGCPAGFLQQDVLFIDCDLGQAAISDYDAQSAEHLLMLLMFLVHEAGIWQGSIITFEVNIMKLTLISFGSFNRYLAVC
ncbi:TPA: hypothetical protein ACH3X2_009702 [Trebouxia sp. C0005]